MSNKTFRFFVTIFLVSIFALCFTLNSSALSATSTPWDELSTIIENEPVEVKEASVKEAWPTFHNEILKSPEGYRFSDKEEADSIEIGPAFRLFEIDNSKAQNSDSKLFSDIIKYDDEWAYILYSSGNPKCLMIVVKINGKYILNRGGEPAGHLVKSLKEFKNKVIKENSNIKPIVVYDGNNYLLIGKDDLKEWVIPAYPTQELSDMNSLNYEAKILTSEDVLNEYRTKINEISNNIQNSTEDVKLAGKEVLKDDTNDLNLLYYLVVGAFAVSILLIVLIIKRRKKANL